MAHIERCLAIIELLAEDAGTRPLGEIADALDLPKSGAHRLLATLVDLGWAEQDDETGFYRLTMRLAVLGQRFYAASGLPDICQPVLDRFARDCREFARLAVRRIKRKDAKNLKAAGDVAETALTVVRAYL